MTSKDLIERAIKVIPGGSQTYSKSSKYFTQPFFANYGIGGRLYSADNEVYDDFNMALGAVILGYERDPFSMNDITGGFSLSVPHPIEVEVAEKLVSIIPSAEMVKFFKNGSDAVEIAVRLARAYTGKDDVLWSSYHGFHDSYISSCSNSRGIPARYSQSNITLEAIVEPGNYNLAAIVVEPDNPHVDIYREMASRYHVLLIFDEVLTGFRHGVGGLQKHIGITPDLSCFGKCMANGLPLSAVVGRADIMKLLQEGVFGSSTFGGEILSLKMCLETIDRLENSDGYLWKIGQRYLDGIDQELTSKFGTIKGYPPRCGIEFSNLEYKSHFQDELLKRCILVNGLNNFCLAHTEEQIDRYVEATNDVLMIMEKEDYMGKIISPMFKR